MLWWNWVKWLSVALHCKNGFMCLVEKELTPQSLESTPMLLLWLLIDSVKKSRHIFFKRVNSFQQRTQSAFLREKSRHLGIKSRHFCLESSVYIYTPVFSQISFPFWNGTTNRLQLLFQSASIQSLLRSQQFSIIINSLLLFFIAIVDIFG